MENLNKIFSDDQSNVYNSMHAKSRPAFVRKVYGILSMQLLVTFLLCSLAMNSPTFLKFQLQNTAIFYFSIAITIILPIVLMCNKHLARQVPTNYVILGLFTFGESYLVSVTCGLYDPNIVCMAAFLTMGITFSLTFYAMTTKTDITYFGGFICMMAMGLFFAGLARIFIRSEFLEIVVALGGAMLYGFYLIYDTQLIMGGKRGALEIDDYIFAALMLYLDIIVMFLKILKLLQKLNGEEEKNKRKK